MAEAGAGRDPAAGLTKGLPAICPSPGEGIFPKKKKKKKSVYLFPKAPDTPIRAFKELEGDFRKGAQENRIIDRVLARGNCVGKVWRFKQNLGADVRAQKHVFHGVKCGFTGGQFKASPAPFWSLTWGLSRTAREVRKPMSDHAGPVSGTEPPQQQAETH